jgi:hypothetical protein
MSQIRMSQIRIAFSLLLAAAFLPAARAAQYPADVTGQYVILSAQYGTGRSHVDVTNRLKELARQDRVFRMGNETFGVDPDPGQTKTLRIYARGPDDQERMFEYREGSTVDGAMFRSWNQGEWGNGGWSGNWEGGVRRGIGDSGQYVILSAQYGTGRSHVDVTNRLKDLARQDRIFRMGNSTFGVDPDPGQDKMLRIYARGPDDQERMFEYREGSNVDGAMFRSWDRGEWGNGGWSGNWEGGTRVVNTSYPGPNNGDAGQFVILSAQYGTSRRHVDVTERLKEVARQDRTFRMGNSTFGVDPDPGETKMLRLYARGPDGQERMFEYREGSTVDGSQFRSWGEGNWGNGGWSGNWEAPGNRAYNQDEGQYLILSAQYGTQHKHVDVTNRLKEAARQDRLFRMDNGTFGVDPDHGHVKTLRIYARGPDGREHIFEYAEGSTVDGSQFRSWGSGEWGNEPWSGRWEGQERDR